MVKSYFQLRGLHRLDFRHLFTNHVVFSKNLPAFGNHFHPYTALLCFAMRRKIAIPDSCSEGEDSTEESPDGGDFTPVRNSQTVSPR
jgi:hypothetical protein